MFDNFGYVKSRRQLRRLIGAVREHLHEQPGWRQRVNGIDSATATVDQIVLLTAAVVVREVARSAN